MFIPPAFVVIQSDLCTGQVTVGVASELPVLGVDFLTRNGIAGRNGICHDSE